MTASARTVGGGADYLGGAATAERLKLGEETMLGPCGSTDPEGMIDD
jgi:hypothetical protein